MKHKCAKCDKDAVWYYQPSSDNWEESHRYLCDEHIFPYRGCSCMIDLSTGLKEKDEQGKLLPCIEFMYSEEGFENG